MANMITSITESYCSALGDLIQPSEIQKALIRYLNWMVSSNGAIAIQGIISKEGNGQTLELPLSQIYIPLMGRDIFGYFNLPEQKSRFAELVDELRYRIGGIRTTKHLKSGLGDKLRESFKIQTVLSLTNKAVITGSPGSGKTTMLRFLAWVAASAILNDDTSIAHDQLMISESIPVPVYVPLNAYAKYMQDTSNGLQFQKPTLLSFVSNYLLQRQASLALPQDFFERLIFGNQCLLLLDGLDEIPTEDEKLLISSAIQDFSLAYPQSKIIVTCRESTYRGNVILPAQFREVRIKEMDMNSTNALITKLYEAIYPHDTDERHRLISDLQDELQILEAKKRQISGKALITSPLLARMLVVVHYNKQSLPNQRAELYRDCIEMMLKPLYHPDREVALRLSNQAGLSLADQISLYSNLAFEMHIKGNNNGRSISEYEMQNIFQNSLAARYGQEKSLEIAERLVSLSRERGGLLEYTSKSFQFVHLGFQEFLAARCIAERMKFPEKIIGYFEEQSALQDPWWREPILLVAGYLNYLDPETADNYVVALAKKAETQPVAMKATLLELAGEACLEWQDDSLLRARVRDLICSFIFEDQDIVNLPPRARANLGVIYSALSDNRTDVHVKTPTMIEIPEGDYTIGYYDEGFRFRNVDSLRKEGTFKIQTKRFKIGKYPVTNYQFALFIESGGYSDKSLWTDDGWKWRENSRIKQPAYWNDPIWNDPSCPVVGVSWYEAIAFCNWLQRTTGQMFRLPTEVEWEIASRGREERDWPWGDDPEKVKCNTVESGIGKTTIVGLFFEDKSVFGIHDLAGNVWEWCNTLYFNYPYQVNDGREEQSRLGPRCHRGGSWLNDIDHAHSANRDRYYPSERNYDLGFRVALDDSLPD